ncbi:MAG: nuclear transport factor 2 family protein [Ilumatobacter sp.]|uniref:ester cyclase n=1 Tax=Ilumatobacter sp. TaxID=1967498 RepID=UPI002613D8AA|nr:nuclear transport factor 2 family protein [Ilumatobacter sp.]MDJ0767658.1 nuclear transport factor 2 family protein [Ilumatobacter sp.]
MDTVARARSYLAALSGGDAGAVAALVTDDFVSEHLSAIGTGSRGRGDYLARLPAFLAQFVDLRYEVIDTVAEGDRVAARYRLTATFDGHPIDIPGVMLLTVRDGLIAHRIDVWDSLTFLRQTGAVEERPDGA